MRKNKHISKNRKLQIGLSALMICIFTGFLFSFSPKSEEESSETALTKRVEHYVVADTGMVMVKGGTFQMGSPAYDNELPLHLVKLKSFYISKYEVTVAQYRAFCEATGREMPKEPEWGWKENYPMTAVSWQDAVDYAKWKGLRLPTEAEWEFAARGGNASLGKPYSGASYPPAVAWYEMNAPEGPQPVGLKRPNELGIYDMSGNVWEWCQDYYAPYISGMQENPLGPSMGVNRVLRGGSWFGNRGNLRVANRFYHAPAFGSNIIGFRVAADAPEEEVKDEEDKEK